MDTKKYNVFFDFDNTVTTFDVIVDILERFSENDRWIELEKKWKEGSIGSKECLTGQIRGLRITKPELNKYLQRVEIDPYFKRFLKLLYSKEINPIVLSDNFDYILKRILDQNGINNLKIFSNHIIFDKDRLILRFPFSDDSCGTCAHCKKTSISKNTDKGATTVYVGDGKNDVCPSEKADLVFAKANLLKYLEDKGLSHIPFKTLKDVHNYFREELT